MLGMVFFQLLICVYVSFLIWDWWTIIKNDKSQWNPWVVFLACAIVFMPGMYKNSLYFPFVLYTFVFTLLIQGIQWFRKKRVSFWMLLLCAFCALSYTLYGAFHFQERIEIEYSLETEKKVKPTRVLFFSDLHYPNGMDIGSLEVLVSKMAQTDPDIVLIGGDITDEQTSKKDMEQCIHALKTLSKTADVFYIYGNHDLQPKIWNKKFTQSEYESNLKKANIHILNDQIAESHGMVIAGRSDYSLKRKDRISVETLLKSVPKSQFTILVDHQPIQTQEVMDSGKVDLMISGHTHNGQLYPFGYLMDLYWNVDLRYGLQDRGELTAITSSGVNGWGFPARTMGSSEFVVIDIQEK